MASLRPKGDSFFLRFRLAGKEFERGVGSEAARAEATMLRVEATLLGIKSGWITVPEGADIGQFIISHGETTSKPKVPEIVTVADLFRRYEDALPEGAREPTTMTMYRVPGAAPLHLGLHPGVGDNQLAVIEVVVAYEAVEELFEFLAEGLTNVARQGVDLGEALCQTVRNLDVLATQLAHQLHVVVAGDTERGTLRDHVVNEPNGVEDAWPTVHEVADEDRFPAQRMRIHRAAGQSGSTRRDRRDFVTQLTQQGLQFVAAAVNVSDDVDGAVLVAFVVVERHALDPCGFHFLWALQHEDVPKALFGQTTQGPAQLGLLLANHVAAEVALVTEPIPLLTDLLGQVQHDGDRKAVVLPGEGDERLARFRLHVGRLDDRQAAQGQPLPGDEVQDLEGVVRHGLIVFLVADRRSAGVDDSTSVAKTCWRAKVLLPEPLGPMRTTRLRFGNLDAHVVVEIAETSAPFHPRGVAKLSLVKSVFGRTSPCRPIQSCPLFEPGREAACGSKPRSGMASGPFRVALFHRASVQAMIFHPWSRKVGGADG
jgi:hypothetical protein